MARCGNAPRQSAKAQTRQLACHAPRHHGNTDWSDGRRTADAPSATRSRRRSCPMPLFQLPLDPPPVTATVVQASLPDRLADPPDPGLVHYARYPKLVIRFLSVQPVAPATTISFSWPVTGAIRLVDLPA